MYITHGSVARPTLLGRATHMHGTVHVANCRVTDDGISIITACAIFNWQWILNRKSVQYTPSRYCHVNGYKPLVSEDFTELEIL